MSSAGNRIFRYSFSWSKIAAHTVPSLVSRSGYYYAGAVEPRDRSNVRCQATYRRHIVQYCDVIETVVKRLRWLNS